MHAAIGAFAKLGPDEAGTAGTEVGDVSVDAFAEVDSIPADDDISVFALGLGGVAALGAGFANANVAPIVHATIGIGAHLDAEGTVEVTAQADVNAKINADGTAGSFVIGLGVMIGRVTIDSDVRARVESRARVRASSIPDRGRSRGRGPVRDLAVLRRHRERDRIGCADRDPRGDGGRRRRLGGAPRDGVAR